MRSSNRSLVFAALAACVAAPSAVAQGGSDIWVAPLRITGGHATLGAPRNVTDRPGYDNQPSWSPREGLIYFSSVRGDGQSDIWSVELASGKQTRVTTSDPESEYSPTIMPSGTALSVVRVEKDSTQRLWRVPLNGAAPVVLLTESKPVGYHAWADSITLALYVLGNRAAGTTSTLQIADISGERPAFIAHDIGRGVAKVPGAHAISFIQHPAARDSGGPSTLMRYDLDTKRITRFAEMLPGVEDFAWTPAGRLLCAKDSQIFEWTANAWAPIANFSALGITGITRLAVSPSGNDLAFVAKDKSP